MLDRSFENEKEKITNQHEQILKGLNKQLAIAQSLSEGLETSFNNLSSARKSMVLNTSGVDQYKDVQKQLFSTLQDAIGGNFSGVASFSERASVLSSSNQSMFATEQDYKRDFFKTYNALSDLEKLTGEQKTEAQIIVMGIETQISQANVQHESSLAALQAQYDAVLGIDKSVISFQEAIIQYQKAQYQAGGANTLLKTQTEILNNQLNALLNISVSILSVSDAINNLAAAQAAMAAFNAAQPVTVPAFASGGVHYGGLRIVGENGPEMEYTPPANITSNNDLKEMLDNTDVVRILKEVKESIDRGNFAVAKNTGEAAKVLKKFDYDGMPEQRTA